MPSKKKLNLGILSKLNKIKLMTMGVTVIVE